MTRIKIIILILMLTGCASIPIEPKGFIDYCSRNAEAQECGGNIQGNVDFWHTPYIELLEVNMLINNSVQYVPDNTEYWTVANTSGDCEDFALAKMHELLRRGWSIARMRLATTWTDKGDYHAVLLVEGSAGVVWVLDNSKQTPEKMMYSKYKWHRLQEAGTKKWAYALD